MKYILSTLLLSLTLYAQDFGFNEKTGKAVPNFVGELKLMKGRALKTTGGRPRPVKMGERFYPKDVVVTEENSSMKILISDDTWLALGPNSELVFTEFNYRDKDDRDIKYELKKGQLSANVRQKIKNGGVHFRSKYSTFGVRGTKLMMNYREVKGVGISEFALVEGQGEVTDSKDQVLDLKAGERIVLIEDIKKKKGTQERMLLSPEEMKSYVSPESEEDQKIRPFMPFYEQKEVASVTATADQGAVEKEQDSDASESGTLKNLKKLNEQLKDNQRKRR